MSAERTVREALARVTDLEAEARAILAKHEASPERLITLQASYERLTSLSLAQDDLFRESLREPFRQVSFAQPMCSHGLGSWTSSIASCSEHTVPL